MTNVGSSWKNDMFPFVKKQFDLEYRALTQGNNPEEWIKTDNEVTQHYSTSMMGGYGALPEIPRNGLPAEADQRRGFGRIKEAKQYGFIVRIGRLEAKVNKTKECINAGKQCAGAADRSVKRQIYKLIADAYNNVELGGDGQPWASAIHPVASKAEENGVWVPDPDAGIYSNLINLSLTSANVAVAIRNGMKIPTPDGWESPYFYDISNTMLIVPPDLLDQAARICGPNTALTPEKDPDNALNAANPTYGLRYVINPLFAPNQWAVSDKRGLKNSAFINFIERPHVIEQEKADELQAVYVPYYSGQIGFVDGRGIVFSAF